MTQVDTAPSTKANQPDTPELWASLEHSLPQWFAQASLGIFIHWGPYSVPAWAEPPGALGVVPDTEWFTHNAYTEWYYNTIRIPGSPASKHHQQVYGGAPYDDFPRFPPCAVVSRCGRSTARTRRAYFAGPPNCMNSSRPTIPPPCSTGASATAPPSAARSPPYPNGYATTAGRLPHRSHTSGAVIWSRRCMRPPPIQQRGSDSRGPRR
jgi:hypothetical protein